MRALLVVNPRATFTTERRWEFIARALRSELDLEVVQTRYRGHAMEVSRAAAEAGYELVVTLGGDGTVNEAVNGILGAGGRLPPGELASAGPSMPPGPALAAVPGGNANVFTRALGLPFDPVDATSQILAALSEGRSRTIGVGLAGDRYFCFNAGLGFDAEVVRAVEGLRARGRALSPVLYLWAAVHQFWGVTDRRRPALTLEHGETGAQNGIFCGFVANTSPWTYLGPRAVNVAPRAGFDTGLDVLAMRSISTITMIGTVGQMLSSRAAPPSGRHLLSVHDAGELTFRATRPVAFQVDGEYVGEREHVTFRAVPRALRVVA